MTMSAHAASICETLTQEARVDGHYTLPGIDGLYGFAEAWWQCSTELERTASSDGSFGRWKESCLGEMLEYRTPLVKDPATGVIAGTNFYLQVLAILDPD